MDAQVRVDPAAGCQVGAHAQDGVLGVDDGDVWRRDTAEGHDVIKDEVEFKTET